MLVRLVLVLLRVDISAGPCRRGCEVAAKDDKVVGLRVVVCQVVVLAQEANELGGRAVVSQQVRLDTLLLQHELEELLPNSGPEVVQRAQDGISCAAQSSPAAQEIISAAPDGCTMLFGSSRKHPFVSRSLAACDVLSRTSRWHPHHCFFPLKTEIREV